MQGMVRNVNADAAFLLAPSGNVQRTGDFDRVLSETSFDSEESRKRRLLSVPGMWVEVLRTFFSLERWVES